MRQFGVWACWRDTAGALSPLRRGPVFILINGLRTAPQPECTCLYTRPHFQEKAPSLWNAAVFLHYTLVFLAWSPRVQARRKQLLRL